MRQDGSKGRGLRAERNPRAVPLAGDIARPPFKPYANISCPTEKQLYETLIQAFSETDPAERPWCGIGLEMGVLALSPTNLTVADIREVSGVEQAVVHVPQNWREPWYVETADGTRHEVSENPCDKAERAISNIKLSLGSFLNPDEQPRLRSIKYLILFPDGYTFDGTKEFSILDHNDVLRLGVRNFRELAEEILKPTQQHRLDSRKYRAWIEGSVLKENDDSVVGTWLDPAFDEVETEPAKRQRWWIRRLRYQEVPVEKEELSSSDNMQTIPIQQKLKWRQTKLTLTIIAAMIIGIIGWRLHEDTKPATTASHSNAPPSPAPPDNNINAAEVVKAAIPESTPALPENEDRDIVPGMEVRKSNGREDREEAQPSLRAQSPKSSKKNQPIESAKKLSKPTQDVEDSELKRQKIELKIHEAIRRRAITGVTVSFVGGKAHLKGRVDTEGQKSAAEKAARSIPGVKQVRSSIEVNFLLPGDG